MKRVKRKVMEKDEDQKKKITDQRKRGRKRQ